MYCTEIQKELDDKACLVCWRTGGCVAWRQLVDSLPGRLKRYSRRECKLVHLRQGKPPVVTMGDVREGLRDAD